MNLCQGCPAFSLSVFCVLNESQINETKENAITVFFKKGQDIVIHNKNNEGMFCIRSGIVKLYRSSPRGENITVGIKGQGSIFGHLELMKELTLFSVACLTDVSLCFFPKRIILSSCERIVALNKRIVLELNIDIAEIVNHLMTLSFKSIKQRTAQVILYLKERTGIGEDGAITLKLSRQELSNIVGASREAVTREIAFLKETRCIEVEGRSLRVIDENRLRNLMGK